MKLVWDTTHLAYYGPPSYSIGILLLILSEIMGIMGKFVRHLMHIQVECHAGYRGEETPRFIRMATYKIEIREIVDRWLSPNHRYFKILGSDEATYIIRHDIENWQWELVFYQSGEEIARVNSDSGES